MRLDNDTYPFPGDLTSYTFPSDNDIQTIEVEEHLLVVHDVVKLCFEEFELP
jgi:hypothetical protein